MHPNLQNANISWHTVAMPKIIDPSVALIISIYIKPVQVITYDCYYCELLIYIFYHGNSVVMAILLFGNLPFKIV